MRNLTNPLRFEPKQIPKEGMMNTQDLKQKQRKMPPAHQIHHTILFSVLFYDKKIHNHLKWTCTIFLIT